MNFVDLTAAEVRGYVNLPGAPEDLWRLKEMEGFHKDIMVDVEKMVGNILNDHEVFSVSKG